MIDLKKSLENTRDLRLRLLQTFEDLENGKVTNQQARTKAIVAREILDTLKVEIMASRIGSTSFNAVEFKIEPTKMIEGTSAPVN